MRLAFEGLKAAVEVPDCSAFLTALQAAAVDWPYRSVADDGTPPAARITGVQSSLLAHYPGEAPVPVTPIAAVCSLMVSLAETLVAENPDRLCFHGGAALFSGRLAVFLGRTRAGKSTLIARLAAGGHTIFGDDILPLDENGDGVPLGVAPRLRVPLPANVSANFRNFVASHEGAADHRYHYLALPEGRLARRGQSAPLGAIVLLDRQDCGPAKIYRASQSLALKLMARQNVQSAEDARPLLAGMRDIVQRLPCLVLSYCDLEDAVRVLEAEFARWPIGSSLPAPANEAAMAARLLEQAQPDPDDDQPVRGQATYRPDMRLVRSPGIAVHLVDGEAFLAGSGDKAAIHHLNPTGLGLWNLLAEPVDAAEATHVLATAFPDIDPKILAADVASLFGDLHESGFAVEQDPASGSLILP